ARRRARRPACGECRHSSSRERAEHEQAALPLPAKVAAVEAAPGPIAALEGVGQVADADDAAKKLRLRRVAGLVARDLEGEEVLRLQRDALELRAAFPLVV